MGSHGVPETTWATFREHIRAAIDNVNVLYNRLGCQLAELREHEEGILEQIARLQTQLDVVRIEIMELELEETGAKLTKDALTAFVHTSSFERNRQHAMAALVQQTPSV